MRNKVIAHFQTVDPLLLAVYRSLPDKALVIQKRNPNKYFESLCREIVGQQLSGKSASAIFAKFLSLFPNSVPTPEYILALSDESLRSSGISWAKVSFVKDLSKKVSDGSLAIHKLHTLSEEEVIKQLISVKGIGQWTAEMFLIFALGKEDIFSHRDLGLRKGLQRVYKLTSLPAEKECLTITQKWSPYRSFGSLVLWRYLEV